MHAGNRPIRRDRVYGTIFGLGLSAAGWALVVSPPATDPAYLALAGLGSVASLVRPRILVAGRISLGYVPVLACLLRYGAGSSVLAGVGSSFVALWVGGSGARPPGRSPLRAAFALGSTAAACVVAAAGHHLARATLGGAGALAAHAALFALTLAAIETLAEPALARAVRSHVRRAAEAGTGLVLALPVAELYRFPVARPWVVLPGLVFLLYLLRRSREDARRLGVRIRDRRPLAVTTESRWAAAARNTPPAIVLPFRRERSSD